MNINKNPINSSKNSNRINLSKFRNNLELPNLIEIQTKTYKWFREEGIDEVFSEIFPFHYRDNTIDLVMNKWWFEKPKRTISKSKEESKTYEVGIHSELALTIQEKNIEILRDIQVKDPLLIKSWIEMKYDNKINVVLKSQKDNIYFFDMKTILDIKSEIEVIVKSNNEEKLIVDYTIWKIGNVFFGDLPLMTERGTFIINGSEKVIVSQLVRSPGAYYKSTLDRKLGKKLYNVDLIPSRGAWIELDLDYKKNLDENKNKILSVKIDKSRKTTITNFLTSLGLIKQDVLELFNNNPVLVNTYNQDTYIEDDFIENWKLSIQDLYKKIRSGETTTADGASRYLEMLLFEDRKYDLTAAGRFKLKQKLGINKRILNHVIAEDVKDSKGNILFPKDTLINRRNIDLFCDVLNKGSTNHTLNYLVNISTSKTKSDMNTVQKISVYKDAQKKDEIITIIGTNPNCSLKHITIPDIVATISYLLNLIDGIGNFDDIDHLGNRRVRSTGELLQNQFRIGLLRIEKNLREKMSTTNLFKIKPMNIINNKPLSAIIGEFFNLSQLSQFMDQTNPLSELTNKRRLTALGPSGLSRERAGLEVRDVHYSHYGRICPIETPEGPNIGLINNLATYAKINEYGFITTPYRIVKNNKVYDEIKYLTADDERDFVIAQASVKLSKDDRIIDEQVICRYLGETLLYPRSEVDYIDVSPKQIVSIATSCIPFLENDDANRALMGANMQRQAIPLLKPDSPYVGTGVEYFAARDSGLAIISKKDGIVEYVDAKKIIINSNGTNSLYKLDNFERSNQGTSITHTPIIKIGDKIKANQVIADGPSMDNGELALGQNVLVAFTTWNGYNYEDAIIISERLVKDDVFTSIHIEEYTIERRQTKLGEEEISREIPNVSEYMRRNLGADGVIKIGSEVKPGDILVGKTTPKGQTKLSPEDKLLQAIFGEKSKPVKDTSLRLPNGANGIIQNIKYFSKKAGHDLSADILEVIKVFVIQKRKIQEGDKMSGRHGNKGIISKILPIEDMPFLKDGTPIDIMLNPLGVPSRMNIGQILELHLGMAAKNRNIKVATPVFEGLNNEELIKFAKDSQMDPSFKMTLYDGRSGEKMHNDISVGIMYMLKLSHMVEDKIHARAVGPYSLITQQPLGGKAQNGGQRFGEMEVWALEAYGAAHTLREILTIKSDDIIGRIKTYESIVRGLSVPKPGIPESFNVLTKEIQGLGFDIHLIDSDGKKQNISEYNKANYEDFDVEQNNEETKKHNLNKKNDSDDDLINFMNTKND